MFRRLHAAAASPFVLAYSSIRKRFFNGNKSLKWLQRHTKPLVFGGCRRGTRAERWSTEFGKSWLVPFEARGSRPLSRVSLDIVPFNDALITPIWGWAAGPSRGGSQRSDKWNSHVLSVFRTRYAWGSQLQGPWLTVDHMALAAQPLWNSRLPCIRQRTVTVPLQPNCIKITILCHLQDLQMTVDMMLSFVAPRQLLRFLLGERG